MNDWIKKYSAELKNFWYIPAMILVGVVLMVRPAAVDTAEPMQTVAEQEYVQQIESQISEMLQDIQGAGECRVTVSLASGGRKEYVREAGKVLVITDKEGNESPVLVREGTPEIAGVTVASTGAGSVSVRNNIIEAVSTLLGIGMNKICVVMMN